MHNLLCPLLSRMYSACSYSHSPLSRPLRNGPLLYNPSSSSPQVSAIPSSIASSARLRTLRLEENCLTLEAIPPALLADSHVSLLGLAGNAFDEKRLAGLDGYDKYMERYTAAKRKLD